MTDILDLIDGAVRDHELSEDAMRWAPDDEAPSVRRSGGIVRGPDLYWVHPNQACDVRTSRRASAMCPDVASVRLFTTAYEPETDRDARIASAQYDRSSEIFEWSSADYVVIDEVHRWIPIETYCRNVRERHERLSRMRSAYRRRRK